MGQHGLDHLTLLQVVFQLALNSQLPLFQPHQIWPLPGGRELHPEFYADDCVVWFSLDHQRHLFSFERRKGDEPPIAMVVGPWLFDRTDQQHLLRSRLYAMASPPTGVAGAFWRRSIEQPIRALEDEMLLPDAGAGGAMHAQALGAWRSMKQLLHDAVKAGEIAVFARHGPAASRAAVTASAWPGIAAQLDYETNSTVPGTVLDVIVQRVAQEPTDAELSDEEIRSVADALWPDGCPRSVRAPKRNQEIRKELARRRGETPSDVYPGKSKITKALKGTKHIRSRAERRARPR